MSSLNSAAPMLGHDERADQGIELNILSDHGDTEQSLFNINTNPEEVEFTVAKKIKFRMLNFCVRYYFRIIMLLVVLVTILSSIIVLQMSTRNEKSSIDDLMIQNIKNKFISDFELNKQLKDKIDELNDEIKIYKNNEAQNFESKMNTIEKDVNVIMKEEISDDGMKANELEPAIMTVRNDLKVLEDEELREGKTIVHGETKSICQRTRCSQVRCEIQDVEFLTLRIYSCCCIPNYLIFKYYEEIKGRNRKLCFQYTDGDPKTMGNYIISALPKLKYINGNWHSESNSLLNTWLLCYDGIALPQPDDE